MSDKQAKNSARDVFTVLGSIQALRMAKRLKINVCPVCGHPKHGNKMCEVKGRLLLATPAFGGPIWEICGCEGKKNGN